MYPLHADNFPTTAMTSTDADSFPTMAITSMDADGFPTMAMTSTDADTPTTYRTEPDVTTTITTTSTPTDYSFVSDRGSSASSVVPTVVGVLSFLMVFIGLLLAATVAVLCLYRKRKSKKRRYIHYKLFLHFDERQHKGNTTQLHASIVSYRIVKWPIIIIILWHY